MAVAPRRLIVGAEVAELLSDRQLREAHDAASAVTACQLSGQQLDARDALTLVLLRDPQDQTVTMCVYADARQFGSCVMQRPELRAEIDARIAAKAKDGLDVDCCLALMGGRIPALAFRASVIFEATDEGGEAHDPVRAALQKRGWSAPAASARVAVDRDARLTARGGELALALPPVPEAWTFDIGPPPWLEGWWDATVAAGWVQMLYGCGVSERVTEALALGELLSAAVPFRPAA